MTTAVSSLLWGSVLTLSVSFTAQGGELTGFTNEAFPVSNARKTEVSLHGRSGNGDTVVDGDHEQRIAYRSFGGSVDTAFTRATIGIDFTRLSRDIDNDKTGEAFGKRTSIISPRGAVSLGGQWELALQHSMVYTDVEPTGLGRDNSDRYTLNFGRTSVGLTKGDKFSFGKIAFTSEGRAEREYTLGYYPMVDRDYAPAQLDVIGGMKLSEDLSAKGSIRYSHYNKAVYEKQYEGDVPTSPSAAQVFDYLVTFKADIAYAINNMFDVNATLARKAALDVNSLVGDEYVVSYGGGFDVIYHPSDFYHFGLGLEGSNGKKTHTVQTGSYDYAAADRRVQGFVAVAL